MVGLFLTTVIVLTGFVIRETRNDRTDAAVDGSNYLVRSGDTIASVADLHGVSVDRVLEANDLTLSDSLDPGSRLEIPELPTDGRSPPDALLDDQAKLSYAPTFAAAAQRHDLPPGLLEALAWDQSEWVNALVSEDGRTGLGQLRSEIVTFVRRDVVDRSLDPTVPEDNIELTAAYLDHLLDQAEGDRAAALVGYLFGLETPAGGTWDFGTVAFVRRILSSAPGFATLAPPTTTTSTTVED